MSIKNRQRALMGIISKKFTCYRLVDVTEGTGHKWIGRPTYMIRYEDCREPGHYFEAEFLPSDGTQKEIENAIAELDYQQQGLEFPEIEIGKKE